MSDRYRQIANAPVGRNLVKALGLPAPVELDRHEPGQPVISGPVLLGAAAGGRLVGPAAGVLASIGAEVHSALGDPVRSAVADAGLDAAVWNPESTDGSSFKALVFDASGIPNSDLLEEARAFFGPSIRRVAASGRVLVLGTAPEDADDARHATAQRALEGLVRSIAKELRRGATAQLVYVAPGGEGAMESTLRFFLSPRSAYVSGQVVRIGSGASVDVANWERPQEGRVAVVTGASRGIGEAIAQTLARDGAHVLGVDVPAAADDLAAAMQRLNGSSLALDITDGDAATRLADHISAHHEGVDVFVHNAGITRDKTLGRMGEDLWGAVLAVNLSSEERINAELLARDLLRPNGRIVCVSSISGIAGNAGQTNYSTSKAGVIGMVQALAPQVGDRDGTINAVAPGFIETAMTAKIPIAIREAGRRMNSMSQGGLPVDVAETIAWFASPGSSTINGNVVRVCGQSLLGA